MTDDADTLSPETPDLSDLAALVARLQTGTVRPTRVVRAVLERIVRRGEDSVWISRRTEADLLTRAAELEAVPDPTALPLYGVPFAVKDNIDVAGMPTTAGCPGFADVPQTSATVVQRLLDAGAILIGKTNLDQFATGLVGTRSPYGVPSSVFHPDYVAGGSSSGSAVATAAGLVTFALGTDTAGSGRVPAAFNGIVGLKPTRGRVSAAGVVPACQSLDCVSIFARRTDPASRVLRVIEGEDPADSYSRVVPSGIDTFMPDRFRFAVPDGANLEFLGDGGAAEVFADAVTRLESIGGERVEIDYAPIRQVAAMLYGGPWVAERFAAIGEFLTRHPTAVHPVVRTIISGSAGASAAEAFRAMHRLQGLRRACDAVWAVADVLVTPTTPTIYRIDDVLAEPYALNANLGTYTNHMNLLDWCGLAVPAGVDPRGLPHGITLQGPAFADARLATLATRYEETLPREAFPPISPLAAEPTDQVWLAVVGAHLSGQPLNHQLTAGGARLVRSTRTAATYRLYALSGTTPSKPGLVYVGEGDGRSIEVEVWAMASAAFGRFVAAVPPPLAIGTVRLFDGSSVSGFVCEPRALTGAHDITSYGGWRAYRATQPG